MKRNVPRLLLTASLLVTLGAQAWAQGAATAVTGAGSTQGTAADAPPPPPEIDPTQEKAENPAASDPAEPPTPPSEQIARPDTIKDQGTETASGAECVATLSEITDLREPQLGTSNVWDIVYAEDGMDMFADAVSLGNSITVAGGAYTKDEKDTIYHPLLVKFDERMKPLWEVREETKSMRTIHRLIATKDGFTVLGDIGEAKRGGGIYIGSYDNDGKVRGKPAPIYEPGGDLDAKAFVQAGDGSGYIIAAQYIDSDDDEQQNGFLYKVSKSGNVIWKRSFKTGRSTVFNNVQTALDGKSYIVTGQIVTEGNTSGGWLLLVDANGAIKWQRTYPRGVAASLQAAAQTKDGEFILTGKARPTNYTGQGLAAWIMKTDSTGNPLWQRFFRGPYTYEAPDLIVYEDGRASVLINGAGMDSEHRSHNRLMTFSPQGRLHHLEDFTEGQNSTAHRLVSGADGERIIVGYAQTSFGENQEGNEAAAAPVYTYDAWLLAATPLDLYEDPCATGPKMSPILD